LTPENTSPFSMTSSLSDISSSTTPSLLNMNRDHFLTPLGEYDVTRDQSHYHHYNRRFTNNNKRMKRSKSLDHQVSHEKDQMEASSVVSSAVASSSKKVKGNFNKSHKNSVKDNKVKATASTTSTGRSSSTEPRVLEVRVSSVLRCSEACLQETSFQCLSANFERVCQLSCNSKPRGG
jgi:hypothetical protein